MDGWAAACPSCGSARITTIRLPRHHEPSEPATTQRAFRCLGCDTQWSNEAEWNDRNEPSSPASG